MDYRTKLCFCRDIYDQRASDRTFMEAVRRNVDCHLLKCKDYRRILESRGFSRAMAKGYERRGGALHSDFVFKYHDLYSVPEASMVIKATSSGTGE